MTPNQKLQAAAQRVQAAFKADEEHDIEVVAKQVMMALDPSLTYDDIVKKSHTVHVIWEWDDTELGQDIKAMDLTLAELGFRKQPGSADLLKYESNNWGLVIGPDISTLVVIQL